MMMMRVRWLPIGFCGFLCFFPSKLLAASFLSCSFLFGKTQKLRSPHSSSPRHQPPTTNKQNSNHPERERNPTEENLEKKKKKRWTLQLENFVFLNLQDDDHQHMWVCKIIKANYDLARRSFTATNFNPL